MRVFKTKRFSRFARKENIEDKALARAVADIERGLIDANLGSGLIKQRVARSGSGKRGGFRVLLAYRAEDKAVFLFGYAKKDVANISPEDEQDLKDYGALIVALKDKGIEHMIKAGELQEVHYGQEH